MIKIYKASCILGEIFYLANLESNSVPSSETDDQIPVLLKTGNISLSTIFELLFTLCHSWVTSVQTYFCHIQLYVIYAILYMHIKNKLFIALN